MITDPSYRTARYECIFGLYEVNVQYGINHLSLPVVPHQSVYKCLNKTSTFRDALPAYLGQVQIASYNVPLHRISQKTGSGSQRFNNPTSSFGAL